MSKDQAQPNSDPRVETYEVRGEDLLNKFKALVKKGGLGKISILSKSGKVIAVFPITAGLVGALLAPVLAAVGAIAALVTKCTIRVERQIK